MPVLHLSTRDHIETTLNADPGQSLMEVIRDAGIDELLAMCGGSCSCATCHVYIHAEDLPLLPPITEDENFLLDGSQHRKPESRLACQIQISTALDGIRVLIAPED